MFDQHAIMCKLLVHQMAAPKIAPAQKNTMVAMACMYVSACVCRYMCMHAFMCMSACIHVHVCVHSVGVHVCVRHCD